MSSFRPADNVPFARPSRQQPKARVEQTSIPCTLARAPQPKVHRAHLYAGSIRQVWEKSLRGASTPLFGRRWPQFNASEVAALSVLGYNPTTWEACRTGSVSLLPPSTNVLWRDLSVPMQQATAALGIDPHSWDRIVGSRYDLRQQPKLVKCFEQACAQQPILTNEDVANMLPTVRRYGFATKSGQRALAYLRDFYGAKFSPSAQQALTAAINRRTPFNFDNHGWNSAVVPKRFSAEERRASLHGSLIVNDASGMSAAAVMDMVTPEDVTDVRSELLRAHHFGWKVNVAGTRHSQGGQSCVGGAVQLDMRKLNRVSELAADNTVWVEAGATWEQLIKKLQVQNTGRTVQVMQASSIFSVGGSISVNCHGRTANDGPIASSVKELRILLASGKEIICSRTRNPELFRNAIGGYGMFGVIVAARLQTAKDEHLHMRHQVVTAQQLPSVLAKSLTAKQNKLAFARLDPTFGGDAIVTQAKTDLPPAKGKEEKRGMDFERLNLSKIEAVFFTISKWSSLFLRMRWALEKFLRSSESRGKLSDMLNLSADGLIHLPWREGRRTDYLEEIFVPFDANATGLAAKERDARFNDLVEGLRKLQKEHKMSSLNITIRHVRKDKETALPYAKEDSLAFVLYYNQKVKPTAARARARLQRALIDLAQTHGGSFYLPYLRAYSQRQLDKSYPNVAEALKIKKRMDPAGLFAPVVNPAPR